MIQKIKTVALTSSLALIGLLYSTPAWAQVTYVDQNATTTTLFAAFLQDLTTVFLYVIGGVIGLAVLTVGIGYGWRKLKAKVFGKGF